MRGFVQLLRTGVEVTLRLRIKKYCCRNTRRSGIAVNVLALPQLGYLMLCPPIDDVN